MVGGVFSQTTLEFTGGTNRDLPSGDHLTSGIIQFRDNGIRSCLGGSAWAASYNSGETHTFTVTLEDSDNESCTLYLGAYSEDISSNWYGSYTPIAEQSISVPDTKTLTLTVSSSYHGVYLYASGYKKVNIRSITRTITTASSVASPTISPASGTYDGDLIVTITPGEGNDKVTYSVEGSNEDASHTSVDITSETVINLTGTGTITVTATGYDGEDASNTVTNTYTYSIPSGHSSTTSSLPHTFNSWDGGNSITFNNSVFSNIETGDYVVLDVENVEKNGTVLGFRSDWNESPYVSCTTTSGGNGAKGTLNTGDTQWWMKVNSDVANALKNNTVRMQGGMVPKEVAGTSDDQSSSVKLTSLNIYKSQAISELENNTIASKINNVVVELTRSFVAGTWNTVCLPFALSPDQATQLFGSDYQLAAFTGVSGTTMQFTTTGTFAAGVPYLVKPTIDVSNANPVVLVDVNITAKTPETVTYKSGGNDYSFSGTFNTKSFAQAEWPTTRFVGANNTLLTPDDNSSMKSLRCYFTVPAGAQARSFTIDEEATGINAVNGERLMVNGYYNLNGQRVDQPTKGLYIVNGRKVIIK